MKNRYNKSDIKRYPEGWYITFISSLNKKRHRISGPYEKKSFAELDMEQLNRKYADK